MTLARLWEGPWCALLRMRVPAPLAVSAPRAWRISNGFCNDWLLRGDKRTFGPFHRGVVTAYALEVGAARQGDDRDPLFSAFEAVSYPIHQSLPIFHSGLGTIVFVPFECFGRKTEAPRAHWRHGGGRTHSTWKSSNRRSDYVENQRQSARRPVSVSRTFTQFSALSS